MTATATARIRLARIVATAVGLAWLAAAGLADPLRLVADLERGRSDLSTDWTEIRQLTAVGDQVVFVATEPSSGMELWVSDGTMLGTRLLHDFEPGPISPDILQIVAGDGEIAFVYFQAEDARDAGLWRTDGTSEGTFPLEIGASWDETISGKPEAVMLGSSLLVSGCTLRDGCELWRSDGSVAGSQRLLLDGQWPSAFEGLTAAGSNVYFTAYVGGSRRLWKTDGTPAGTVAVRPDGSFFPDSQLLAGLGSRLLFVGYGSAGAELWASDGTADGTAPLTDFAASSPFEATSFLRTLGNAVYFLADDVVGGSDLWRSDGTRGGTYRVTDFGYAAPFPFNFQPQSLALLGSKLFFPATDGLSLGLRLWSSRGTPATTVEMTGCPGGCPQLDDEAELVVLGSRLVFTARAPSTFTPELWSTDGTPGGTVRLPVARCGNCGFPPGLPAAGGKAYFVANDPDGTGFAVWLTDGTAAGTRSLASIGARFASPNERFEIATVPGKVLFQAYDGVRGRQLWATDGSTAGTAQLSVLSSSEASSVPFGLAGFPNRGLIFSALDGTSRSLWFSDGTTAGTSPLAAVRSSRYDSWPVRGLTPHAGLMFFSRGNGNGDHAQLWRTDGTDGGTLQLTSSTTASVGELVVFEDKILFPVFDDAAGASLWTSDGTVAGTRILVTLPAELWRLRELTAIGHELYFIGRASNGYERAWRSDGSVAGTRALTVAESSPFRDGPASFTALGSKVYFRAAYGTYSTPRLWRTDGTAAGTAAVFDDPIAPGTFEINDLVAVGGSLLYFAPTELGADPPQALYRSDGTAAGTVELVRFAPPLRFDQEPRPAGFTILGGSAYFAADDGEHGQELWVTDTTAAGTHLVHDLAPGLSPSWPHGLVAADGSLFFAATDGTHGVELWQSDGTAAGTRMVQDLAPGGVSSDPEELTVSTGQLFFTADDGVVGREVWTLPLAASGCQPTSERLCLNGGRYAVEAHWRDFAGNTGAGHATALTADTGTFWFFGPENVEVILKVLDGRGVNGHMWVFYGALSSVEYTLTVTDTQTGAARRYVNVSGRLGSVADTVAFGPRGATPSTITEGPAVAPVIAAEASARTISPKAACTPSATRLCLRGGRFAVEAHWSIPGSSGDGQAVGLTSDTGYLWFFNAENVELVVKVLDGRPVNGKFWVFYGALSDVEYTLTVTDTQTGSVKEYHNPHGRLASAADTSAF